MDATPAAHAAPTEPTGKVKGHKTSERCSIIQYVSEKQCSKGTSLQLPENYLVYCRCEWYMYVPFYNIQYLFQYTDGLEISFTTLYSFLLLLNSILHDAMPFDG
mgnify:CR=1 FL=1|jgi:hypothetical protein